MGDLASTRPSWSAGFKYSVSANPLEPWERKSDLANDWQITISALPIDREAAFESLKSMHKHKPHAEEELYRPSLRQPSAAMAITRAHLEQAKPSVIILQHAVYIELVHSDPGWLADQSG